MDTRPIIDVDLDLETRKASIDPRIPIYLVTGATDESKFALLERIAGRASLGTPYAFAITNSHCWKTLSDDGETVAATPDMVRMVSGEICCYAADDLVHALYQLHLRKLGLLSPKHNYEAIVFELDMRLETGTFAAVVQNDTRVDATYRIARILYAVEAGDCAPNNDDRHLRRIGEADTIILTHTDVCDAATLRATRSMISSHNPFAAIEEIDNYQLDACRPWRIRPGEFSENDVDRLCSETGIVRPNGLGDSVLALASNLYNEAFYNESQNRPASRAVRIIIPGELDLMAVMQAIEELSEMLGPDVLRLYAVLNVRNADYPISIEVVGGTLLHPAYHSQESRKDSDICIAARGLDVRKAVKTFQQCSWESAANLARLEAAV
jgi:G3E family GTPase